MNSYLFLLAVTAPPDVTRLLDERASNFSEVAREIRELFGNPAVIEEARLEFEERRGPDFVYESLIGDRAPPLDYRK